MSSWIFVLFTLRLSRVPFAVALTCFRTPSHSPPFSRYISISDKRRYYYSSYTSFHHTKHYFLLHSVIKYMRVQFEYLHLNFYAVLLNNSELRGFSRLHNTETRRRLKSQVGKTALFKLTNGKLGKLRERMRLPWRPESTCTAARLLV